MVVHCDSAQSDRIAVALRIRATGWVSEVRAVPVNEGGGGGASAPKERRARAVFETAGGFA
jgi:hypothetical protein